VWMPPATSMRRRGVRIGGRLTDKELAARLHPPVMVSAARRPAGADPIGLRHPVHRRPRESVRGCLQSFQKTVYPLELPRDEGLNITRREPAFTAEAYAGRSDREKPDSAKTGDRTGSRSAASMRRSRRSPLLPQGRGYPRGERHLADARSMRPFSRHRPPDRAWLRRCDLHLQQRPHSASRINSVQHRIEMILYRHRARAR